MIVLPDEEGLPVSAHVKAAIGEALRQSVAGVEPSAGFEARLAAALDAAGHGGPGGVGPGPAGPGPGAMAAGESEPAEAGQAGGPGPAAGAALDAAAAAAP